MPTRRTFLFNMLIGLGAASCPEVGLFSCPQALAAATPGVFRGREKFDEIIAKVEANKWQSLPIGELMGKIALMLEGTPYVAHTLENSMDQEVCTVDLTGLDCVTFFESTLDLARMIKKGLRKPEDLLAEVTFTRYRGAQRGDYTSRLHYTTDWFADNAVKNVVKMLDKLPGSEVFPQKVGVMTSHPEVYKQLAAHPELVPKMKNYEGEINKRTMMYVPLDKIASVEPLLKTGDIVGICTSLPGVDIAHTGLIYRDQDGVPHFMDASSKKSRMKVTIEPGPISQYFTGSKDRTGVMFARPVEVNEACR